MYVPPTDEIFVALQAPVSLPQAPFIVYVPLMLFPSAERVPVKRIVTPPKLNVSDTLFPLTEPVILSLEKLGRMHARPTRIPVVCSWPDDRIRLASTTSELAEPPDEPETNPNTHGLAVGEFDVGLA